MSLVHKYFYHVGWVKTIGVILTMLQVGIAQGWPIPNLARLKSDNSTVTFTDEQLSWVASAFSIGGFFAAFIVPISICYLGSKNSITATLIVMGVQWVCLLVARIMNTSLIVYFIFRWFCGITCSMALFSSSLYLAEISLPQTRGTLITIAMTTSLFGKLISIALEYYVDFKVCVSIYLGIFLISLMMFIHLKSTPYHLLENSKVVEAEKSISMYFPESKVEDKLREVEEFIALNVNQSMKEKLRALFNPVLRKSVFVTILTFFLPNMSGYLIIDSYMHIIITDSKSKLIDPKNFVIYVEIISIIIAVATVKLIDLLGRRIVFSISSIGTSLAMVGLGIQFYLVGENYEKEYLQWLPVLCIPLYQISYTFGYKTVPLALMSETFPNNLKSLSTFIAKLAFSFSGFISVRSYQLLADSLGMMYPFLICAAISSLSIFVVIFLLPETKGKTFLEIQMDLRKNH